MREEQVQKEEGGDNVIFFVPGEIRANTFPSIEKELSLLV
jgi:hypothetical protein